MDGDNELDPIVMDEQQQRARTGSGPDPDPDQPAPAPTPTPAPAPAPPRPASLTRAQAFGLYLSHALSTWNARGYEFATILFTAAAYPDTLTVAALRMFVVYLAQIALSGRVGAWVEGSPDRLRTLLATVACGRSAVVAGSLVWLFVLGMPLGGDEDASRSRVEKEAKALKGAGFALAVALGVVERLSASGNLISMERDWIVAVAAPAGRPYDLTHLNAVMRRVDLACKLVAPLVLSGVVVAAAGSGTRAGVVYTALTSLASWPVEVLSARRVWRGNALLREPKPMAASSSSSSSSLGPRHQQQQQRRGWPSSSSWWRRATSRAFFLGSRSSFDAYLASPARVPSLALALLHFNMLTWRATFVTYLLSLGYALPAVTAARAAGSVLEIASTVAVPRAVTHLGRTIRTRTTAMTMTTTRFRGGGGAAADGAEDESRVGLMAQEEEEEESGGGGEGEDVPGLLEAQTTVGLMRTGLWGLSFQLVSTVPMVLAVFAISPSSDTAAAAASSSSGPAAGAGWGVVLFAAMALSRFGVWAFDLTTQQLTQSLVCANQRAAFAGAEAAVVGVFELLGVAAAVALPRPPQYPYLALASLACVAAAWAATAAWVRRQRGHLVHWEKLRSR
ncbi:hypothetical protein GGR56DRAFT_669298 [Xylariaceae sp. FL0804]|nr:hypothetical protein GGR56DRAFT_669298 [Xylariaceae sp. FL0804]